jgi:polyisoprenoid-binding protein YceI
MTMMTSLLKTSLLSATLLSATVGGIAHAGEWDVDPTHSSATFSVKHMMVSTVRGEFEKVSGTVNLDDAAPTKSTVEVVIDATTINTRNAQRDAHLKSPDFFDAAKFPTLTFKSTKIEKAGKGKYKVTGDLTMHGVTKPLTLEVEGPTAAVKDMMGRQVRGVSAKGKLSRKEWGLTWNKALEAGSVVVGDEIQIQLDAELVAKAAAPAGAAPPAAAPAAATKPAAAPAAAAAAPKPAK